MTGAKPRKRMSSGTTRWMTLFRRATRWRSAEALARKTPSRPDARPVWPAAAAYLLFTTLSAGALGQPSPDGARPGNVIGTGQSLPRSDDAGNLNPRTTRSLLAPNLPAPPASDDLQTLLLDARASLQAGRTGQAQEALERAETRALDRSVLRGTEHLPAASPVVSRISAALQALGAGQTGEAIRMIEAAVPEAAQADIPR